MHSLRDRLPLVACLALCVPAHAKVFRMPMPTTHGGYVYGETVRIRADVVAAPPGCLTRSWQTDREPLLPPVAATLVPYRQRPATPAPRARQHNPAGAVALPPRPVAVLSGTEATDDESA